MKKTMIILGCLASFALVGQSYAEQAQKTVPSKVAINKKAKSHINFAQDPRYSYYVMGLSGDNTLYGNYPTSPYQSNFQVEALRHTVWGSLVPRKKVFDDPAKGRYPWRYSSKKVQAKKDAIYTKEDLARICGDKAQPAMKADSNALSAVPTITPNSSSMDKTPSIYEPVNENKQNPEIQKKVEEIQNSLLTPSVK